VYTLGQAARATGKSKTTIHKAVKTGRVSASRTPDGHYEIDPSELHRVYPKVFASEPAEPVARPEVVAGGFTLLPPSTAADRTRHQDERPPEREVELLREMLERERSLNRDLAAERDHWREQAQRLLGPPAPAAPAWSWWARWRRK
jgi:hypothetical protein